MLSKHNKITDYSIWNGKICFFEVFSFDHLNDFGDYFIKILEKLFKDLPIIINIYEYEKIAENRLIDNFSHVESMVGSNSFDVMEVHI